MQRLFRHIILQIMGLSALQLSALNPQTYSTQSVLSSGRWVKIEVSETGFHYIPETLLTKWGFVSSKDVRIFGYGCLSKGDLESEMSILDDLPQIPTNEIDGGILFFAYGPVNPSLDDKVTPTIKTHPYTSKGYYFITSDKSQPLDYKIESQTFTQSDQIAETYSVTWHQAELYSPGQTGQLLVGEDFTRQSNQTFTIPTPAAVANGKAVVTTSFLANSFAAPSTLKVNLNGTTNSFTIEPANDRQYDFGNIITPHINTTTNSDNLNVNLEISSSGQLRAANLDYIAATYQSDLSTDNLIFFSKGGRLTKTDNLLFDITDPYNISCITSQQLKQSESPRCYQIIDNFKKLPTPSYNSVIANQDIHSDFSLPQMIIITPEKWKSQATWLAKLHNDENISTIVLSSEQIYNEFSSGRFDPIGLKKCLKMYYDRGNDSGQPLKYALLFGRGVFDNRQLTTECQNLPYPILPTWQSETSLSDLLSYTTDDYYAILNDKSGNDLSTDTLSIAVGRLCITSTVEADKVVDKIVEYATKTKPGNWKSKAIILADDGDSGCHLQYAENMIDKMKKSGGEDVTYSKIYLDAFHKSNGTYPEARQKLETELNSGAGWWTFMGHANQTSLTADKILTYKDILNLDITIPPAMIAFTCDFLRCDNHNISGGELLLNNQNGGVIAIISATRPVNLNQNGELASSFGSLIYSTENDNSLSVGEIFRRAKNQHRKGVANDHKLRYILLGDPALKIASIKNKIVVKSINDIELTDENQPIVGTMSRMTIEGQITQPDGGTISNFNGTLNIKIFDATTSITTNGNGSNGAKEVYDTEGQILYIGIDTIIDGTFKTTAIIPAEITDNYRNASMQLYALDNKNEIEASGIESRFYIFGKGDGITDTIKPSIEDFYINRPSFKSGDIVNSSPTIYITMTDDNSIDISTTSIVNRMLLKLDDKPLPDISLYYSPISSTKAGGKIVYPLQSIDDGHHTLTFEVSDIAGNRTRRSIEFISQTELQAEILKIYTTTQPAFDRADFYIEHNRPNELINVTLHIFDLKGNLIWETTRQGRSETFKSEPFSWNLIDRSNRRVQRGIYIYRFTIKDLNGNAATSRANKIAVT